MAFASSHRQFAKQTIGRILRFMTARVSAWTNSRRLQACRSKSFTPNFPEVAAYAREHKEAFQRYVARLAQEAGAPAQLAPQLSILAEGAQTTAAIAGSTDAALQARAAAEVLIDAALSSRTAAAD